MNTRALVLLVSRIVARILAVPAFAVALVVLTPRIAYANPDIALGANANRHICVLSREKLDRSYTTWVRVFIPASPFISGARKVSSDPQIRFLKSVAESGRKVILSIKWNLKDAGWKGPPVGSPAETRWFSFVDSLLDEMKGRIEILSIINELYDDTNEQDLRPAARGQIPFVVFQERLIAHIKQRNPVNASGRPLPIYTGGLTGVGKPTRQQLPAMRAMLQLVAQSDLITGLDFHMHVDDLADMESAMRFVRSRVKNKPIIVTEFSPVWQYKKHLSEALGVDDRGRKFAHQYGLKPKMNVADYVDGALAKKVPEKQWHDFLASRSWFDPAFLTKATNLMERYGVIVATYGLAWPERDEDEGRRARFTTSTTPWVLNMLYSGNVAIGNEGNTAVTFGLFDDYKKLQGVAVKACERQRNCPWGKSASLRKAGAAPADQCMF